MGTIRRECLDYVIPLSEKHLRTISKRTGCTVLTEATLSVYGGLGRWMRRED